MLRKFIFLFFIFTIVSLLCCNNNSESQNSFNIGKYESICLVWGFLKYHHPGVGTGNIDWDKELISCLNQIDTTDNIKDLNLIIQNLIHRCDDVIDIQDSQQIAVNIFKQNNYSWLSHSTYINYDNLLLLNNLRNNKPTYDNYYVSQDTSVGNLYFNNENPYADSVFPSKNLRLLALFRYWNIINYFYPYLELNDKPWGSLLNEYIPRFIALNDTNEYHLMMLEFTSQLNDGHVWTESLPINLTTGIYSPPFKARFIEESPIIYMYFSDSLCHQYNVNIGDQILEIDNKPIQEIINSRKKYYSLSNKGQYYRRIVEELLITPSTDSLKLLLKRNDSSFVIKVKPYPLYDLYQSPDMSITSLKQHYLINDSVGYINLQNLELNDIQAIIKRYIHLPKLIIDIRNYPLGILYELSKYLNPSPTEFAKVFIPNINQPGQFIWSKNLTTGIENKEFYKGKVVLLVNEQTQSHAEFTVMCIQSAPNVVTIGNTTAGTDGNVSYVYLPGDIITYFTGIGIVYPDTTQTQRIGVKIDSIIKPEIVDFQNNIDRLINSSINY